MTAAGSKKLITAFCFLLLFYFTCFSNAFAQHLNAPPAKKNLHPKISSCLQKLEKEYKEGANPNRLIAQGAITGSSAADKIPVYLMSASGSRIDENALIEMGAEITKRYGNVVRAKIPVNILTTVADTVSGVSFMKTPDTLIPTAIESEGVNLTGADTYHNAGYDGTGVKVAVFDVGFAELSSATVGTNVVKVDCTGSRCASSDFSSETDSHGTEVAEIVHDMAPGAKLYLMKISDTMDLEDAKNYAIQNGIKIINLSGGYLNQNFYDGTCWSISNLEPSAVCAAEDAYEHNILWVNAAGNEAHRHFEVTQFIDGNNDRLHDEAIGINVNSSKNVEVFLTWNAWPTTDQDFDLYVYDKSDTLLEKFESSHMASQPPIVKINNHFSPGQYYLKIYNYSANPNHRLELYSVNYDISPSSASTSLLNPADAAGVMAVGAINYSNWTTGPQEFFSSQGPTTDGRIKPDIMGPDHVSNSIEGVFVGTSASSPHVAGAAALILDKNPGISVDALRESLTSTAINMGSSIPNNIYGYGRLNLDINAAIPTSAGTSGGGGGGCFIATAAYGSYEAPYVMILRKMRDRFLLTNAVGKAFVHLYYTYSPPMADIIANHNSLKIAVRIGLLPLVGVSWLALKTGVLFTLFTLTILTLFIIGFIRLIFCRMVQRKGKA